MGVVTWLVIGLAVAVLALIAWRVASRRRGVDAVKTPVAVPAERRQAAEVADVEAASTPAASAVPRAESAAASAPTAAPIAASAVPAPSGFLGGEMADASLRWRCDARGRVVELRSESAACLQAPRCRHAAARGGERLRRAERARPASATVPPNRSREIRVEQSG